MFLLPLFSWAIEPVLGAPLFFVSGADDSFEAEGAADSLDMEEPPEGLELSPRGELADGADSAPFAPPWFMPCADANDVVASKAAAATEINKLFFIASLLPGRADHHDRNNADSERAKRRQVPVQQCDQSKQQNLDEDWFTWSGTK